MKVIIAGSRDITNPEILKRAIAMCQYEITEVISGGARGVDRMGEAWAKSHGVPVKVFPANWETYGKAAGYMRNEEMALYADGLIALWDGESRGTKDMIARAKRRNMAVFVLNTAVHP